jgi:hypothetical protein
MRSGHELDRIKDIFLANRIDNTADANAPAKKTQNT